MELTTPQLWSMYSHLAETKGGMMNRVLPQVMDQPHDCLPMYLTPIFY